MTHSGGWITSVCLSPNFKIKQGRKKLTSHSQTRIFRNFLKKRRKNGKRKRLRNVSWGFYNKKWLSILTYNILAERTFPGWWFFRWPYSFTVTIRRSKVECSAWGQGSWTSSSHYTRWRLFQKSVEISTSVYCEDFYCWLSSLFYEFVFLKFEFWIFFFWKIDSSENTVKLKFFIIAI